MDLRILYHGNCFDGVSSAAFFSKFYRAKIKPDAEIGYTPTMHRAGNAFDREQFDGDENAIVDFKYCADDRLTWWFDHHQSAFLSKEDERHFLADESGKKFLDTESKSCAEFIAKVAKEKFGFEDSSMDELIEWAHIIDGALYESPAQCVELRSSALKLMQVIESEKDPKEVEKIIIALQSKSLDEVVASEEVRAKLEPILEQHWNTVELIKSRASYSRGVVSFDLTDKGIEGYNKFIPYYFYPQTTYNVALTQSTFRTKISVGSNPWSPRPRLHNIAEICERYGGGGHAVVGAVSLKPEELELGKRYMKEIIEELQFETD
ncbi:MAG: phosphoesterase [Acidobacteria bacterium]|nr:MAG: phosphoesterase [Acidobacteriota bacterium]REJ97982.1 MAG: phosphoesterase [Acidobacteriota bacterium]REK16725.1 MAG: phosphoesterase [Acidobacteriota bacterium]REK42636.1 MAG: phosphoesterase [Acidobacteriota bacterium]